MFFGSPQCIPPPPNLHAGHEGSICAPASRSVTASRKCSHGATKDCRSPQASAASANEAAVEQVPAPGPPSSQSSEKAWTAFRHMCDNRRWLRGCACVPKFTYDGRDADKAKESQEVGSSRNPWRDITSSRSQAANVPVEVGRQTVVDVKLWNAYWEAYSDHYGDLLDGLGDTLEKLGTEDAPRQVALTVVGLASTPVAAGTSVQSATEAGASSTSAAQHISSVHEVDELLLHYALFFGALEYAHSDHGTFSFQFTHPSATMMFCQWAQGMSLHALMKSRWPAEKGAELATSSELVKCTLEAKVAPHNTCRVTNHLLLGPHVLLSTAFVESLFKGMFDATQIIYQQGVGSFIVEFRDPHDAKLALHALQYSLLKMFGLWLIFV